MQFLKTLFWVLLAVFIALFASRNWSDATLNLWGTSSRHQAARADGFDVLIASCRFSWFTGRGFGH